MLFFRRLLNFNLGTRLNDLRNAPRHAVGEEFPLKATVTLLGTDQIGVARSAAAGSGCRWSGRPRNLSHDGLSLHLPPAAVAARGEETSVIISIEGQQLEVPCVVAHFHSNPRYSTCGLTLKFSNAATKTAYQQLLQTIGIGASFTPVKKLRGIPAPEGLIGEQYKSGKQSILTVWRRSGGGQELAGFELVLGEYCAKGDPGAKSLSIYTRQPENRSGKVAQSAPTLSLSAGKNAEVRQLYRWVVLNLSKSIPTDVRDLLGKFIAKSDRAS